MEWDPRRYAAEIDLANDNDSHVLMIKLVGGGKRVLDVGCWTGEMGARLRDNNLEVVGLEREAEAADIAAERLDRVVTGDVEVLDLEETFGTGYFDTIVLGDVLEHLTDPAAALRRLRPLLARGGTVVASIPNVAHGSVRLRLLSGEFTYTDVGLLDRTHLRFFTRTTMEQLFEQGGFVVVDVRATTVDPLAAPDAPLAPTPDEGDVVRRVQADPDAHVYQFVVRAVPDDADHAIRDLRRRQHELESEVASLRRSAGGRLHSRDRGFVQLAVVGGDGDQPGRWCSELLELELGRRSPDASPVVLADAARDVAALRWADAVVRVGRARSLGAPTSDELDLDLSSAALVDGTSDGGPALIGLALHAVRALKPDADADRSALLRLLGLLPREHDYVVVAAVEEDVQDPDRLGSAIARLAAEGRAIVRLPLVDRPEPSALAVPAKALPEWLTVHDVVRTIDGASALLTTHPTLAVMACAVGTPHALVGADGVEATLVARIGGGLAGTASEIDAALFRTSTLTIDAPATAPIRAHVDDVLDELARSISAVAPDPLAPAPADPDYVAMLEGSVASLQSRLVAERRRMGQVFEALGSERLLDAAGSATRDRLEQQLRSLTGAADTYRRSIAQLQELLHEATRASEPVAPPPMTTRRLLGGVARRLGLRRR